MSCIAFFEDQEMMFLEDQSAALAVSVVQVPHDPGPACHYPVGPAGGALSQ